MKIKYFMLSLIMLSFFAFSFGAVNEITTCPTNWVSGDTYVLKEGFPSSNCIINNNSITITNDDINGDYYFSMATADNNDNVVFQNMEIESLYIRVLGIVNNITLNNITTRSTSNSGLIRGESYSNAIFGLNIYDSYFYTEDDRRFISRSGSAGSFRIHNLTMINNDILGFSNIIYGYSVGGTSTYADLQDVYLDNNVFLYTDRFYDYIKFDSGSNCNVSFNANNFFASDSTFNFNDDNNYNFENDELTTLTSNSCQFYNGRLLSQKTFNSDSNKIAINHFESDPNYYQSNKDYYLANSFTFNTSNYLNFDGVTNTNLNMYNGVTLTIDNINQIKMGSENSLIGASSTKSTIATSGTINAFYDTLNYDYGSYGVISYVSGLTIDNIDFNLDATGNYGLIKKVANSGGQKLTITNSEIDVNFVPTNINTPLFVVGYDMTLENNLFDFGANNNTNYTAFTGGFTTTTSGSHYVVDNEFKNGGYIFQKIYDTGTKIPNVYLHNKFNKVGSYYSYPFDINNNAVMIAPELYGDYYYKTACDSYLFNIGNYYQDLVDLSALNDTDGDGIDNIGWLRGYDDNSDPINDIRVLMAYPYDFNTYIGTAVSSSSLCGDFTYNIVAPIDNNTYASSPINTDFEFLSSSYTTMAYCEETINGEPVIYYNVTSGQNKGSSWETTDGQGYYKVKCCDNLECSNLVKESEQVTFCVGSCNTDLTILNINETTTPDGDEDGDGDGDGDTGGSGGSSESGGAGNYDYEDIEIFGDSISETTNNVIDLLKGTSSGVVKIGLIIGLFMFMILILFAMFNFIIMIVEG